MRRNELGGPVMAVTVTGPAGEDELAAQTFSVDGKGVLHLHDEDGPVALYAHGGWHKIEVNGSAEV